MFDTEFLKGAGLTKGEAEAYGALLRLGEGSAAEIAQGAHISRPNIYDVLEGLKHKGLVSVIRKNKKTVYIPADPKRLIDQLDENRERVKNGLLSLQKIFESAKMSPRIELFNGAEGFQSLMNDVVDNGEDFVGWGASDKVREYVPKHIIQRYLKGRKKQEIRGKMLQVEGEKVLGTPLTEFKSVPTEFYSESTTLVYADRVAFMIYGNNPTVIIIQNGDLAKSFKNHFQLLWNRSKKKQ